MVPILALWLPILIAAVLVLVASTVMHMAPGCHENESRGIEDDEDVMGALRPARPRRLVTEVVDDAQIDLRRAGLRGSDRGCVRPAVAGVRW